MGYSVHIYASVAHRTPNGSPLINDFVVDKRGESQNRRL